MADLKARFDLIPADALAEVAEVFAHGAHKHTDRGWEKGRRWGEDFAAVGRHLWKFWNGEDLDPQSGKSHLAHAIARLLIILASFRRNIGEDDRRNRVVELRRRLP